MRSKNFNISLAAVIGAVMLIVLLVSAVTALNVRASETEKGSEDSVTVSGSYTVYVAPDKAAIHFAIVTNDDSAKKAQEQNAKEVNNVIDKLKELGVKESSIVTDGYNIYQNYDYDLDRPSGYNVNTSLTVKDVKIDKTGTIIQEAVAAGVNEVNYISYTCSNYDEEYENALADAVAAARKKAEVLAKAAGRSIGEVQNITEGYQDTSARYINRSYDAVAEEAVETAEAADMAVLPGDSEITANVTVTWYLK